MIAIRFANPIICPQMRQSWSGNDTSQPYPCNRRLDCACDQARRAGVAPVSIFIIIGRYGSSYCHWHTKAHAEISRTLRFRAKHQPPSRRVVGRTGAVQDAARISGIIVSRRSLQRRCRAGEAAGMVDVPRADEKRCSSHRSPDAPRVPERSGFREKAAI
jgi:hypothetical protein